MKITRKQLRKLIAEMSNFNIGDYEGKRAELQNRRQTQIFDDFGDAEPVSIQDYQNQKLAQQGYHPLGSDKGPFTSDSFRYFSDLVDDIAMLNMPLMTSYSNIIEVLKAHNYHTEGGYDLSEENFPLAQEKFKEGLEQSVMIGLMNDVSGVLEPLITDVINTQKSLMNLINIYIEGLDNPMSLTSTYDEVIIKTAEKYQDQMGNLMMTASI